MVDDVRIGDTGWVSDLPNEFGVAVCGRVALRVLPRVVGYFDYNEVLLDPKEVVLAIFRTSLTNMLRCNFGEKALVAALENSFYMQSNLKSWAASAPASLIASSAMLTLTEPIPPYRIDNFLQDAFKAYPRNPDFKMALAKELENEQVLLADSGELLMFMENRLWKSSVSNPMQGEWTALCHRLLRENKDWSFFIRQRTHKIRPRA